MSLGKPKHSFCPNCQNQLRIPDLIPLLSWLFLGGKCRHCKLKISSRYFFVELFTGALFALVWYQNLVLAEDPWRAFCLAIFMAGLVAAIGTDLAHYIIPDQLNATLLVAGLIYNAGLFVQHSPKALTWGIPSALAGWLVGTLVIWFITLIGRLLFGKDAMGHGDIKMMRGIGAMIFPTLTIWALFISVVFGMIMGIVTLVVRARNPEPESTDAEEEQAPYEPESIGSIFKCGAGYFLLFDVVGLAFPKFAESYFGENPYACEDLDEEDDVPLTMIPFGPSLALGAMVAVFCEPQLFSLWNRYLEVQGLK